MVARKVLTRAESQAQTRQDLLDSAEQLFSANGYHATSINAIAAEAGRTIGAVYSNFDSKEALCLEVLRNRLMSKVTKLVEALMATGESVDDRLGTLSSWWAALADDETRLVILAAEYMTSTFNDEGQRATTREMIDRVKEAARALLEDVLPEGVSKTDPRLDDALDAMVSTGTGLAIAQSAGIIDAERGAALLATTLRMWFERLSNHLDAVAAK